MRVTNISKYKSIFRLFHACTTFSPKLILSRYISASFQVRSDVASAPLGVKDVVLRVVSSGSPLAPKGLVVTLAPPDNSDLPVQYIFNVIEDFNRCTYFYKLKPALTDAVFITRCTWTNTAGLIFLAHARRILHDSALTAKSTIPPDTFQLFTTRMRVASPPLLDKVFGSNNKNKKREILETFVRNEEGSWVELDQYWERLDISAPIERSLMTVHAVPLLPKLPPDAEALKGKTLEDMMSVCYICKPNFMKCDETAAKLYEIPIKVAETAVNNKQDVIDLQGRLVRCQKLTRQNHEQRNFLVVDCPSVEHFQALRKHSQLQVTDPDLEKLPVVVHFTPSHVANMAEYKEWAASFGEKTDHLILNEDTHGTEGQAIFKRNAAHNLICPSLFPLLARIQSEVGTRCDNNFIFADQGFTLKLGVKSTEKIPETWEKLNVDLIRKELNENTSFREANKKEPQRRIQVDKREFPSVTMLGTASMIPTDIRGVTAILVQTSPNKYFLMDCGPGTRTQLLLAFGSEGYKRVLRQLKGISVSHIHEDHCLGLPTLIYDRWKLLKEDLGGENPAPIPLFTGGLMHRLYGERFNFADYNLSDFYRFYTNAEKYEQNSHKELLTSIGLKRLEFPNVIHIGETCGVIMELPNKFKLAYSSDTGPCRKFASAAWNCDLMIHESTFLDRSAMRGSRIHSSVDDAIKVADVAKAKHLLLTHYSGIFYDSLPFMDLPPSSKVVMGYADDFIRVQPCNLHMLPNFHTLFRSLDKERHEKALQRHEKQKAKKKGINLNA